MSSLENYFEKFRQNILGIDAEFVSPYGKQPIVYADWIASGRLYSPIEKQMFEYFGPMVGNTHSESSETGVTMTHAYHYAHKLIKKHVNASDNDVIITVGSGMTGVISKMQRILGVKVPDQFHEFCGLSCEEYKKCLDDMGDNRPVVFVTHLEHHSNHTSWLETIADVVVIPPDENYLVKPENLEIELKKYESRKLKIGSFSACSNVTGVRPPYYELSKIMHKNGGICFVDFAASAPYDEIDMHPEDKDAYLDGVFFSPHKFLGGPGSSGVMVFNSELCKNDTPDQPGGGTVKWTNRWNEVAYIDDIEVREDGGTPAFLQAIRAALAIKLKEQMTCEKIHAREKELLEIAFSEFDKMPKVHILADNVRDRLGVISFYVDGIHHNLIVKLLNDMYGVQVRGGCSCAGTYGHILLHVDFDTSHRIANKINQGDLSEKPGWVRLSLHPTMTDKELMYIINGLKEIIENIEKYRPDYVFNKQTGEFSNVKSSFDEQRVNSWFNLD